MKLEFKKGGERFRSGTLMLTGGGQISGAGIFIRMEGGGRKVYKKRKEKDLPANF